MITIAVAIVGTLLCYGVIRLVTNPRASEMEERIGLDTVEHGERAYPAFDGLD